jgi:hypothetical protein
MYSLSVKAFRVVVFSAVVVLGCETIFQVTGTIIDEENGMPLDSVNVSMFIVGRVEDAGGSHALSDSLGKFEVVSGLYGCGCGCPEPYVIVEKSGFVAETLRVDMHSDNRISMKRQ